MIITLATLAILFYLRHLVKSMWNKGQCKYVIGSFVIFVFSIYLLVSSIRTLPPKVADIQPQHHLQEDNNPVKSTTIRDPRTLNSQSAPISNQPSSSLCLLPTSDQNHEWPSAEDPYLQHPSCKPVMPLLFKIGNKVPIINPNLVDHFKNSSWSQCFYRYGYRLVSNSIKLVTDPYSIETDSDSLSSSGTLNKIIKDSTPYDIIGIECNTKASRSKKDSSSKAELVDILGLVQKKPRVEDRIKSVGSESSDTEINNKEGINVQLIILESSTRIQFLKFFKQSHQYITQDLSGIEFEGLSMTEDFLLNDFEAKSSSQLFPSIAPLLTGITNAELKLKRDRYGSYIWRNFSSQGYYTGIAENCPELFASLSLKRSKGRQKIERQPTHYYLRDSIQRISSESVDVNHEHFDHCTGPGHSFESLLNYGSQLAGFTTSQNDSSRRYFHVTCSCTRGKSQEIHASSGHDEAFLNHLKSLKEQDHLNNSVVLIIGSGNLSPRVKRELKENPTKKVYEYLPVSYLIVPKWFRTKYKAAVDSLEGNRKALVTNFDVYETLRDLLDLGNLQDDKIMERSKELQLGWDSGSRKPRGISLFLPVPKTRDCEEAHIQPKVCPCV